MNLVTESPASDGDEKRRSVDANALRRLTSLTPQDVFIRLLFVNHSFLGLVLRPRLATLTLLSSLTLTLACVSQGRHRRARSWDRTFPLTLFHTDETSALLLSPSLSRKILTCSRDDAHIKCRSTSIICLDAEAGQTVHTSVGFAILRAIDATGASRTRVLRFSVIQAFAISDGPLHSRADWTQRGECPVVRRWHEHNGTVN